MLRFSTGFALLSLALGAACAPSNHPSESVADAVRTPDEGGYGERGFVTGAVQLLRPSFWFSPAGRAMMRESVGGDPYQLQLTMLLPDGARDGKFGSAGTTRLTIPGLRSNSKAFAGMAARMREDGSVLFWGSMEPSDGAPHAALVQIRSDGSLDTSFGEGSVRLWSEWREQYTRISSLVDERDATGTVVGYFALVTQQGTGSTEASQRVFHLDAVGTVDASFGGVGFVTLEKLSTLDDWAGGGFAMSVDAQGRLLLVATRGDETTRVCRTRRLTTAGDADTSFGDQGIVDLSYPDRGKVECFGLPLRDGSTLLSMSGYLGEQANTRILRLDADGRIVPAFPDRLEALVDVKIDTLQEISDGSLLLREYPGRIIHRWKMNGEPDLGFGPSGKRELGAVWSRVLDSGRVLAGYEDGEGGWVIGSPDRVLPPRSVATLLAENAGPTPGAAPSGPGAAPSAGADPDDDGPDPVVTSEPGAGSPPRSSDSTPSAPRRADQAPPTNQNKVALEAGCTAAPQSRGGGSGACGLILAAAAVLARRRDRFVSK